MRRMLQIIKLTSVLTLILFVFSLGAPALVPADQQGHRTRGIDVVRHIPADFLLPANPIPARRQPSSISAKNQAD